MIDVKTIVRTTLINSAPVVALVPASRIFVQWPTSFKELPVIAYKETTNYTTEEHYFDSAPIMEYTEIQIDVFHKPGTSTTPITQAVDNAMTAQKWNREYAEDFVEPDTGIIHKVLRYSNRLYK